MRERSAHVKTRAKKRTHVGGQVPKVKALGVSRSLEFERPATQPADVRRTVRWLEDNQQDFVAYAGFVERHGVFNEDDRGW